MAKNTPETIVGVDPWALNAELLTALHVVVIMARAKGGLSKYECEDLAKIADAAIAKAEGRT